MLTWAKEMKVHDAACLSQGGDLITLQLEKHLGTITLIISACITSEALGFFKDSA